MPSHRAGCRSRDVGGWQWQWQNGQRKVWTDAERSLQLEWLHTVPGYKELLKQRVSQARKRQAIKDDLIYRGVKRKRGDYDDLGREVEGCG